MTVVRVMCSIFDTVPSSFFTKEVSSTTSDGAVTLAILLVRILFGVIAKTTPVKPRNKTVDMIIFFIFLI